MTLVNQSRNMFINGMVGDMTSIYKGYKTYNKIKLTSRMEEVLLKLWKYPDTGCDGYSHYVLTINALFARGLVENKLLYSRFRTNSNNHVLTKKGKKIVQIILNL